MKSTVDALGLYHYDPTLFDLLQIPEGMDRELVVDNILLETAELEILYPSAPFFKGAIGVWSRKLLPVWQKLKETTEYEYNAIHNYDRTETHTDKETRDLKDLANKNSITTGKTTNGGTDTQNEYKRGVNIASPVLSSTTETKLGSTATVDGQVATADEGHQTGTVEHEITIHAAGNIGVTTTQQMIEAERQVVQFTVIDQIVSDFKKRFCLMVY